jgi:tetratricopeptide (TPR) repeat protein
MVILHVPHREKAIQSRNGDPDIALNLLNQIVASGSDDKAAFARELRANILYQDDKHDAINDLDYLIRTHNPRAGGAAQEWGILLFEDGSPDADSKLQQAIALDPKRAAVYYREMGRSSS